MHRKNNMNLYNTLLTVRKPDEEEEWPKKKF